MPVLALDDCAATVSPVPPIIPSVTSPVPAVTIPIRINPDAAGADPNVLRRRFWYRNATGEKYDACGDCRA